MSRRVRGGSNIQLSGGEPTVRDDLPEIIALCRSAGFAFVQLNANGIRLGREPGYGVVAAKTSEVFKALETSEVSNSE